MTALNPGMYNYALYSPMEMWQLAFLALPFALWLMSYSYQMSKYWYLHKHYCLGGE